MSVDIRIILAQGEAPKRAHMIVKLAEVWSENGLSVAFGPIHSLCASVGILHVDRTVVEPGLVPKNPNKRPILNGSVLDISKRRFSANLLDINSSWDGPVLVKTDANAFGHYEMAQHPWHLFKTQRARLAGHLPWRLLRELPRRSYPILKSLRDVPGWVWDRPDLVVERFLPERVDELYALRIWIFLGNQEYGAVLYGTDPIMKVDRLAHFEYLHEFPDSLRKLRRKLGFDYGKFDYVMVNGEAVLLDANRTPSVRAGPISANVRKLASGIDMWIKT